MFENSLSASDVALLSGNNRNNDGFGGGDGGFIWIILLLVLFGGFGGNGFGNRGGSDLQGIATRADINEGFALNGIENGIRGIQNGLCDSTFALNNAITNGFHGTDMQLCGVQRQISDCCCQTQGAIKDVSYQMAQSTCDIVTNGHADTDRVIAQLNAMETARQAEKIHALELDNQKLSFQASQTAQNGYIDAVVNAAVQRLLPPSPMPAYQVPNPNCCYNNSCGGCGC